MVRELFVLAREHAPSIIFMDEIDSVGGQRLEGEHGDSEVQRTMMELLNQLDGFESTQNIKVWNDRSIEKGRIQTGSILSQRKLSERDRNHRISSQKMVNKVV